MDSLPTSMRICAKIAMLTLTLRVIVTQGLHEILPHLCSTNTWALSLGLSVAILSVDAFFIYPFFRSPLRHLPTERTSVLKILNEQPRGATTLKWFKKHPEADMIHGLDTFNNGILFLASPAALRDVLGNNSYDFEKTSRSRAFLARIIGLGLILSEGDMHKKQRKALTPAFNIRNIRALYSLMWEKTGILLSELQAHASVQGHVEMSSWASRLTLDIIGPAALSRDFQSMTSGEHGIADAFGEILEPSRSMLAYMASTFFLPQWLSRILPVKPNRIINRNAHYLRASCHEILRQKHASLLGSTSTTSEKVESTDIMTSIISSGQFNDDEVVDQMLTFLAAGHETTASALTWCSYLLSRYPDVQSKLRAEIREYIPAASSQIGHDTLEAMPYLNGVCEEVLRLFPTVPITTRESLRKTTIAEVVVPARTLIVMPIYAVNRNPRFWGKDADEMVPERWIDTAPDGTKRPNRHGGSQSNYCGITFLHGQRSCIGRDFAKAELRCAVAGLFGRYIVRMLDPDEEVIIAGTVTTKPRGGLKVTLEAVDGW